ncbi:MAG: Nicotinamide mononucleotide transporter PnuC [Candidatus Uhrbacteria bacterium GW2011_GWF2_41_16]|uniref:Nicotinamide mononucleotide transporter PnuC n=1 Tax=Candidatus Uhrbacteria bacterium GW2011_GWF2_41_16 TaxID=1618997 RepID=A0A0G0XN80_9BACT|nr:MAG: nicotinamide mononucleotide transporter PnuC, nicotinamide mononucleotide transporter [Candidatus Peregrinibacteria bacterium GW2011_GWC2_39_14]KKR98260.1 MAG: Nicotinamide mononucleotide transporter PnuC [Candidatus Uhrbacteria bacterium GW2011_GWF2_41_16]
MEMLQRFMDINTICFTLFGYPMSYIEFFGTIFTIWCVWLTTKAKILSWPVGLIGSFLYVALFYQIQLYADLLEQMYFIVTGFLGWVVWSRMKKQTSVEKTSQHMTILNKKERFLSLVFLLGGTAILSYATMHFHVWFPQIFSEPVSLPVLDAGTTIMSFLAQWLLVRKKLESWILWILVDAIGIGLYWYKGVKFISLEYVLFFFLAVFGFWQWNKIMNSKKYDQTT